MKKNFWSKKISLKIFFQNKFLKFQISESAKNPKTVTGTAGPKKNPPKLIKRNGGFKSISRSKVHC